MGFSFGQSNAFQSNAFQINGMGAIPPIIVADTRDAFEHTPDQWKQYRDRLLALSAASEKFLQSKYVVENITEIEKLEEEIQVAILEAKPQETPIAMVLYTDIRDQLNLTNILLDKLIAKQKDEDDVVSIILSGGF